MNGSLSSIITNRLLPYTERAAGNRLVAFALTIPAGDADLRSCGRTHQAVYMKMTVTGVK